MEKRFPITVAKGDGIGPEIMDAVLFIFQEAGAPLDIEYIEIGEKAYLKGHATGITEEAWESLRRTKVFFKAPITTPQGGGYKSLNVTVRKTLGLYANVRPCVAYDPVIATKHPGMNVVIIRENEEGLYGGIEHQQTPEMAQALRLISRSGTRRLVRYAFEYARQNNRKKVTCFTKDNILKLTDGLFHKVFDEVAKEYDDIESEHWIVDIGMAKMADTPEDFDVIVMPNLYGDIGSDIAAQIAGSVGLAGSANVGEEYAMFEAIHGSAPRRAGQGVANPSGLLLGGIMMLVHLGLADVASRIHNAWLRTLEDGIVTYDVAKGGPSVGTMDFTRAVAERLGQTPQKLKPVAYKPSKATPASNAVPGTPRVEVPRALEGVDVFLYHTADAASLGSQVERLAGPEFRLAMLMSRGVQLYPGGIPETFPSEHWCCRFLGAGGRAPTHADVRSLLGRLEAAGIEWIKLENLYQIDGRAAYSWDAATEAGHRLQA